MAYEDQEVVDLDVRNLEPPIPMEKALARIARLGSGQKLRLLIHREPFPLYELLDGMGYLHQTETRANGDFVVLIEQRPKAR
jgi:uncharacterized protein (DUF2249 family)